MVVSLRESNLDHFKSDAKEKAGREGVGMIVIDAHLDLAWNALSWNRDLTLTVPEIRASEAGMKERNRGTNTVAFPEMR